MNYPESQLILEEIKKANKILLNCHRGPDPDGIGSTLAMRLVLINMGKTVDVICPTKKISKQTEYLDGYSEIKLGVDFSSYNFSDYDLFITLDTPNVGLMTGSDEIGEPKIKTIVIDHHFISTVKSDLALRDVDATSVGEMLFNIFSDWDVKIDKKIAECLLTSIIGDTGAFSYPNVTPKTLATASELMSLGADKNMIADRIYRSEEFKMLKFWSLVLSKMEIDYEYGFVYALIPFSEYKDYVNLDDAKAKSASLFAPVVDGTDFGFIGVEEKPNYMTISFRGRTTFDTSQIAKDLGGGGHKVSSATKIEGLEFAEVTQKVLAACRKYANKKS